MWNNGELHAYFVERGRALIRPAIGPHVHDALPLPIYAPQSFLVVTNRTANVRRVRALGRAFASLGISDIEADIKTALAPSCDRMVVQTRMIHLCDRNLPIAFSELVYYLHKDGGRIRTEMLEIIDCPAYALFERQHQYR